MRGFILIIFIPVPAFMARGDWHRAAGYFWSVIVVLILIGIFHLLREKHRRKSAS